jgi:hypothetical protein
MKRASAPGYDLFKTIVTVILAAILLLMLLRGCALTPAASAPTEIAAIQNATEPPASVTIPAATSTEEEATATLTASPAATAIEATVTATVSAATVAPDPTTTPANEETTPTAPVEVTPTSAQDTSCNTSAPSRLNVGQSARVLQRLNMRSEASIDAPILLTNPTSTQVDVIGGPVCTPVGENAYLWWQIRLPDGAEGWSAEMPLNETSYFLEPIP